ncbi:putative hydrolase of the HAD superfamily [Octadecabacter temperatus]|uniref:DUMP phosphatase n=1 Tax=Octadecabacter temperatus TaxID=1458307 RepID=A0A0K0Y903_9RHOB|nr:HAD family hydrolase [Octadecabacter temperatus]AKS47347.1 dUMP phosphatase [Octadecabacter temperatus]SIO43709.1 putative hydrolase of the HAD superfamily [Octadecabacter temperatus]
MNKPNWTIAFDADDTLWHNERGFALTQARFAELLRDHTSVDHLMERLLAAERRNMGIYGFGIKGFTLSMVETALEITSGAVSTDVIAELLAMGRGMLADPVELLPGVREAIEAVKPDAEILLITKGDLLDQERKLAQSGLGDLFDAVEIVSDKTPDIYSRIFARHDTAHQMMVGNSLRSDVIPAIEVGAWGVHVPHELTWEYEHAEAPVTHRHFRQISTLSDLPALVKDLG